MQTVKTLNVLLLCSNDAEAVLVEEILDNCIRATRARSLIELREQTEHSRFDAVLVGCSFHQTRCKDTLEVIGIIAGDLPIFFMSWPEDAEWKQMMEARGLELLLPFCGDAQTLAESEQVEELHQGSLEELLAICTTT